MKVKHKITKIHKGSLPVSIILTVRFFFFLLYLFVSYYIIANTFPLNFVLYGNLPRVKWHMTICSSAKILRPVEQETWYRCPASQHRSFQKRRWLQITEAVLAPPGSAFSALTREEGPLGKQAQKKSSRHVWREVPEKVITTSCLLPFPHLFSDLFCF